MREMTDDQATIAMVEANLQRETILPSEKAFAYKMRYEAMRHQGFRSDLSSSQNGTRSRADAELAKQVGESRNQVQRIMRLTELIPELLELVDNERIAVMTAVDISFLPKEVQKWIYEYIKENGSVKANQITALRNACTVDTGLSQREMIQLLNDNLPTSKPSKKVTFSHVKLKQYFPPDYTAEEMEEIILQLLVGWKQSQERR